MMRKMGTGEFVGGKKTRRGRGQFVGGRRGRGVYVGGKEGEGLKEIFHKGLNFASKVYKTGKNLFSKGRKAYKSAKTIYDNNPAFKAILDDVANKVKKEAMSNPNVKEIANEFHQTGSGKKKTHAALKQIMSGTGIKRRKVVRRKTGGQAALPITSIPTNTSI